MSNYTSSTYEMTLDDVRSYLIQTGALSEAEKLLHLKPSTSGQLHDKNEKEIDSLPMMKVTDIKERILKEREIEKEKIMRNLLTRRHQGVAELQQEDEEMRKLQLMESKLRDENIQIELMKQKLAEEMKHAKRTQLDDMAAATRRELEQLERSRLEMERNMEIKRLEIEELQNELRNADDILSESSKPRERTVASGQLDGYSKDHLKKDMNDLIDRHTKKLQESKVYEVSASHDQLYLRQGIVPSVSIPSNQYQLNSDDIKNDESIRIQEERIKELKNQYLSANGNGINSQSNLGHTVDQLNDILDAETTRSMNQMKQLYQNKYNRHGTVSLLQPSQSGGQLKVDKVPVDQYLDKWLNNEVPGEPLNPTLRKVDVGLRSDPSSNSKKQLVPDSLDAALNPSMSTLSSNHSKDILRSQSSQQSIKPNIMHQYETNLRGTSKRPSSGKTQERRLYEEQQRESGDESGDYFYRERFRPSERLPRQKKLSQSDPRAKNNERMYEQNAPYPRVPQHEPLSNPYPIGPYHQPNPYQFHGMPPNYPYGPSSMYPPYGQSPYYQAPPAFQHYPPLQQHMPFQFPPQNQPPGPTYSNPQQLAPVQQLNSVAEYLEQENSRLAQLGNQALATNHRNERGKPSSDEDIFKDIGLNSKNDVAPGSPPKRLSRAEIKHREEMKQLQFEMEKLKMTDALEDMKSELERKKAIKMSEDQHQAWLEEQKRQLQALKIKQALAAEESKLQEVTSMKPENAKENAGDLVTSTLKRDLNEPLPSVNPVVSNYVDNMSINLDGLFVPKDLIRGQLFRLCLSFFTSKGKPLGRNVSTNWIPWDQSSSSLSTLQVIQPPLSRTPPRSNKMNANICANRTALDLGNDNANFLIVLCELQYKETEESMLKPLGWCAYNIPIVSTLGSALPGMKEDELRMFPGLWRVKIRKGISNPQGRQKSSPEDATEGWFLCRLSVEGDSNNPGTFSSEVTSSATISILSQKYISLEGGAVMNPEALDIPGLSQKSGLPRFGSIESVKELPGSQPELQPQISQQPRPEGLEGSNSAQSLRQPTAGGRPPTIDESRRNSRNNLNSSQGNPSSRPATSIAAGLRQLSRSSTRNLGPSVKSQESKPDLNSSLQLQPSILKDIVSQDDEDEDSAREFDQVSNNPMDKYWVLGTPTGPCTRADRYQRGDGIDIYLDGAMFLPDNCTVTRCVIKVLSNDFEVIGEPFEVYSAASEGNCICPLYKYKIELRDAVFNTTMTLLIRIDTLCAVTMSSCGVGYCALKLFCNQQREQSTVTNDSNVFINTGLFQLPVYGGRLKKGNSFNENTLSNLNMPQVPCASLLVRVFPAPKSSDGLLVLSKADYPPADWERLRLMIAPPASYLNGNYDGRLCEPNSQLLSVFETKALAVNRAVDVTCKQAVLAFQAAAQAQLPPHIEPCRENLSSAEIVRWIESLLLPSSQIDSMIDYTYALPYDFTSGISVCVDELHSMPDQGIFGTNDILYKVIYSMNPPGLFYKDPPLAEGLHFTRGGDKHLASPLRHPAFGDGFAVFHPTVIENKLCYIFDIRLIQLVFSKQKADYDINLDPQIKKKNYWCLLPVGLELRKNNGYSHIRTGCYQIPLIEGPVPPQVISSPTPYETTLELLRQKKSSIKLSDQGSTILVRVLHPLLTQLFSESMKRWQDHINTSFLYEYLTAAQQSNPNSLIQANLFTYDMSRFTGAKVIEKQFNKSKDLKKLLKKVNMDFAQYTHIHQDAI